MKEPFADWKAGFRPLVPIWVRRLKRHLFGWRWFRGHYKTWSEAQAVAIGYDAPTILEKVLRATLEVKAGRGAFERDSVVFETAASDTQLIAELLKIANRNGGRLRVLDFGGSLGTTYWQHRRELNGLVEMRWDVVEQTHFVEAGRTYVAGGSLNFFRDIDEAERHVRHDVLLISTTLQFLPNPHSFLDEIVTRGFPFLLLHNVPLHDDEADYLMVEHVPPDIYTASYPAWFFNRSKFYAHFSAHYVLDVSYASPAIWWVGLHDYPSTGLVFRRLPDRTEVS
jgi:putative methyltransferase (TIGR04325 family)